MRSRRSTPRWALASCLTFGAVTRKSAGSASSMRFAMHVRWDGMVGWSMLAARRVSRRVTLGALVVGHASGRRWPRTRAGHLGCVRLPLQRSLVRASRIGGLPSGSARGGVCTRSVLPFDRQPKTRKRVPGASHGVLTVSQLGATASRRVLASSRRVQARFDAHPRSWLRVTEASLGAPRPARAPVDPESASPRFSDETRALDANTIATRRLRRTPRKLQGNRIQTARASTAGPSRLSGNRPPSVTQGGTTWLGG